MKKYRNLIFSVITTSLVILVSCEETDTDTRKDSDFDYSKRDMD